MNNTMTITDRREQRTMRAARILGPGRADVIQTPLPVPGPTEVLIRLEGCGVCASNGPPWEGRPWFKYPLQPGELGHESWGSVVSFGGAVHDVSIGARVATLSTCAYAEYVTSNVNEIIPLPDELTGHCFPGEPLGCAINIFNRSDIRPSQLVAIVGLGFLGAILTQLATAAGASVIAVSRRPFALEVAREMGAVGTIPFEGRDQIVNGVKKISGGALCDCVIEAVGKQEALDVAAELVRERGRLIIAGYHQDGPRQVNMQMWNWGGIDVINAHERDPELYKQGIREAAAAVISGRLKVNSLYTHRFPLSGLGDALHLLKQRPDGFMKALITM